MIHGIGIDIIEIDRIKMAHERHGERFLNRLFTPLEIAYCKKHQNPYPSFAARFAAKEAIVKALGTGFVGDISWHDIEIKHASSGKPEGSLKGALIAQFPQIRLELSLSHSKTAATAVALAFS